MFRDLLAEGTGCCFVTKLLPNVASPTRPASYSYFGTRINQNLVERFESMKTGTLVLLGICLLAIQNVMGGDWASHCEP